MLPYFTKDVRKKNASRQILKIEWRISNIYVFDLYFNQIHIFKCIIVFYVPVIAVYGDMMGLFTFMIWLNCLSLKKTSKIYPPLPTSVHPISITKTLLIVPTKNERDPPLFTGKLLIKFQNILRNTTQVIIRYRVKILFWYDVLQTLWVQTRGKNNINLWPIKSMTSTTIYNDILPIFTY